MASHEGGYADSIGAVIAIFVFAAAVVLGLTGAVSLGQHAYEGTHHVHVAKVAGDWGSLFFNIGSALILVGLGILLCVVAAIVRRTGWLIAGLFAMVLAVILGLVLAPHFEAKVFGRPTTSGAALGERIAEVRWLINDSAQFFTDH
jgi:hypothetical protein